MKKKEDGRFTEKKHYNNAEVKAEDNMLIAGLYAQTLVTEAYEGIAGPKKELIINAMEMTWIDAKIDDTPNHDFMLYPGDVIKLEAHSKFSLLIGNAGGVTFTYEGESFGPIGEPEEVVRLNLPK